MTTESIPTPEGWKLNGDIVPGDMVFARDGNPVVVTHAFDVRVPEKCYRLTFDDGSQIDASDTHLWLTYDAKEMSKLTRSSDPWRAKRRASRPSRCTGTRPAAFSSSVSARNSLRATATQAAGSVRTTQEVFETLRTKTGRANHAMPVAAPLVLPEAKFALDPYLLGLWLGDGTARAGSFTSMDEELF